MRENKQFLSWESKRSQMRTSTQDESEESFIQEEEIGGKTNQELFEIVHNDQRFMETVRGLNLDAEVKINNNNSKEALMYLTQAESILEYAASCGKNIDRSLIISILHNEACAYQRTWDLPKCSNYLEALIFNMTQYLQLQTPKIERTTAHTLPACNPFYLDKSMRLIKYYLQYAAVSSQIKNNEGAHQASKKAINLVRQVFKVLNNSFCLEKEFQTNLPHDQREHFELKSKIVESITNMEEETNQIKLEKSIVAANYLFHAWCKNKVNYDDHQTHKALKDFIIGNVMQILCYSSIEKQQNQKQNIYFSNDSQHAQSGKIETVKSISFLNIIEKVILLSISFFTAGTQLRLFSNEKYKTFPAQERRNAPQMRESQLYHLTSLMIIFAYIPFEIEFINHIMKSYQNNFQNEAFKESQNFGSLQLPENVRQIDPNFIHLYYSKKHEVKVVNKKFSRVDGSPRSKSRQKSTTALTKIQRRCKKIISKKYNELPKEETENNDEDTSKSQTYIKKQRSKASKSCRSKKSLSVTNTVSKKQKNNYMRMQDYYSPVRQRKKEKQKEKEKEKTVAQKIKGYYQTVVILKKQKPLKKLDDFRSPAKSKLDFQHSVTYQKKGSNKKKANIKKSAENVVIKPQKIDKQKSKSKSKSIKGVKTISFKSTGLKFPKSRGQKTPNRVHRKENSQNEYYI